MVSSKAKYTYRRVFLSHYFLVYELILYHCFDRESTTRCRRKGGQDKCDYVHLGAQCYCICDVSWSVLKLWRIPWFAEEQPKHMSSRIAPIVVPGVFYRFGLDSGLKIYFLIFSYH